MLWIVWFILGTLLGSFSLVLITRYKKDGFKSSLTGRSQCDNCHHVLGVLDLIPIFSYVISWGKCRYCQKTIKINHLIFEILFGCMAVILAHKFSSPIVVIMQIIILTGLIIISGIDWLTQEIAEIVLIILIPFSLVSTYIINKDFNSIIIGLIVAAALFLFLVLIGRGMWMGLGDVEVAAFLGLWLGYPVVIFAIMTAFVTGAIYGIYLIATKKAKLKEKIAFGPFLVLGGFMALFFGQAVIQWYLGGF
jgi:leader peptidase (prepilin peptidase)/N-methyltransferase